MLGLMGEKIKNRLAQRLFAAGVTVSRRPPFVRRNSRYRDRSKMINALGPELGREVAWAASEPPALDGGLAGIFAETRNIHKWPNYLPIYESALPRSRPIRMLEIGVARGGSLQMWRRYLHPESLIVGIDIDPETKQFDNPVRQIHVRVGSQVDTEFLQTVIDEFGPFDAILDDGSHMNSHIAETFRYLFPQGCQWTAETAHGRT
jgi:hypothetical protein